MSAHGLSPWRTAFELLVSRRTSGGESVTSKDNAKGERQYEVVGVPQDAESLADCAQRVKAIHNALSGDVGPRGHVGREAARCLSR